MDISQFGGLAANTLTMLQPYLITLAAAAAQKMGEAVPAAVGKVWALLEHRMNQKPAAKEALDDLKQNPQDPDLQTVTKVQLTKMIREDPDFARELANLLEEARGTIRASGSATVVVGDNNRVVGARGVMIGDHSDGNVVNTGTIDGSFINTGKVPKK
jgi:hypothetical protein